MRASSLLAALAATLSAFVLVPACVAAERQPFEMVKGWEIERTVGNTSANPCLMSHAYEDKDDNNAANAVIFALDGSKANLVLVYQGWGWDKGEKVKAPILLDKKMINAKANWIGDGKTLSGQFSDGIVPDMLAARKVILRFDNGTADFEITNFAAGYESLRRCDAAPTVPQASTAAVMPSDVRMTAYAVGIAIQTALKECDVSSTGSQRAAVDAKMTAMQPEMTAVDAQLRGEMNKDPASRCPSKSDEPGFQTSMRDFIAMSPDEFGTSLRKKAPKSDSKSVGADVKP